MALRQPIIALIGHIDHGKSSILDYIRESSIIKSEAGGITQKISSFKISLDEIKKICGSLIESSKIKIPGFLMIDTPGHAAFNSLRKRGGNLADIAILVVDLNEGLKDQTLECLEILKITKTPFIIAANKLDLVAGWNSTKISFLSSYQKQSQSTQRAYETKLYELVGKIYEQGFETDQFDRIDDYTKKVAVIPCSAKSGEGIPELLSILVGLTQKFLEKELVVKKEDIGKGTILEVKEEKGTGIVLDTILYDGKIKVNDQIIIGNLGEPILTKVRSLIEQSKKNQNVKMVYAASSVKIIAPNLKEVLPGMPFRVTSNERIKQDKEELEKEIDDVIIDTDKQGVVIKAESLGSLEAMITLLREKGVMIKSASIGPVTKADLNKAESDNDPLNRIILAFNVKIENKRQEVKIISHDVIYKVIEGYEKWHKNEQMLIEVEALNSLVRPFKFRVLRGYIFRQSNPAVVGVEVLEGDLKAGASIMNLEGSKIGEIKTIQSEKDTLEKAGKGQEVAISIPGATVGRQVREEQVFYSAISENDFRELKKFKKFLKSEEILVLKEIIEIKRRNNPMWGV